MWLIIVLGQILASVPHFLLQSLCDGLAWLIVSLPLKRNREVRANLHHAFPLKSETWRLSIARRSVSRMIETSLFVFALPYMSNARLRRQFRLTELPETLIKALNDQRPILALLPHFALMEATVICPYLHKGITPRVGVIYRPLANEVLEKWIQNTRQRFGIEMISRKAGFFRAKAILEQKGMVVILFDQNAGDHGVMSLFMDRLASSTDLPGKLACHAKAEVCTLFSRRTGFWQADLSFEFFPAPESPADVLINANNWLEKKMREDEVLCANWLWMHRRWKFLDNDHRRFSIESRRSILDHYPAIPRQRRYWIRLPNWLGDVIMAIPLIRALRESRPDAEITLIAKAYFLPLLKTFNIAEHLRALPERDNRYFFNIRSWCMDYPDAFILFTNSFRGDLEARLTQAPLRFGIQRPGKQRPLLTHAWKLPADLDESLVHQTEVWNLFMQHFGLKSAPDFTPLGNPRPTTLPYRNFGFICGTENSPEKRWNLEHWTVLLKKLLTRKETASVTLFGTTKDKVITDAVCHEIMDTRIRNRAGETNLTEFATSLQTIDLLICNDTGGMHLANALGVPILALFGPTNPLRTGPIFHAQRTLLQPENCPRTGGADISKISPERVFEKIAV